MVSFLLWRAWPEFIVTTITITAAPNSFHLLRDGHFTHIYYLLYSNNIIAYKESMFSSK